jgi:endonuclease
LEKLVSKENTEPTKPTWQHVLDAVQSVKGGATQRQIEDYFRDHVPGRKLTNIRPDATMLSVNEQSRIHFGQGKSVRRSDSVPRHKHDALFFRRGDKRYEIYNPAEHGVWEIALGSDGQYRVKQVGDAVTNDCNAEESESSIRLPHSTPEEVPASTGRFALEAHLRDYLAQNLEHLTVLQEKVELYRDALGVPGIEYRTQVGFIDILARGASGAFYVFELKLGRGSDVALGQLMRYMGWISAHLANGANVRGVIVAAEVSDKLRYAAASNPNVTLLIYDLKFTIKLTDTVCKDKRAGWVLVHKSTRGAAI